MPFETNLRNTVIFLVVFILAFFPAAFQYLLRPILNPFSIFSGDRIATSQASRVHNCCPTTCTPPQISSSITTETPTMSWFQKQFTLPAQKKGSYLVTDYVLKSVPEIREYKTGLLHLFIQHTSCGLSLNENFDTDVRADMTDAMDRLAPEDPQGKLYRHADEGLDDMPAHIKSMLVGASVSVPITDGKLNTGTWQGIWYLEFRSAKQARRVVATIQGEKK